MDITLFIKSSFDTVYLINGSFFEKPNKLVVSSGEIAFITVLPLSAGILPYTVKLSGGKVFNNTDLCSLVKISPEKYLLRFFPRYNYVYAPSQKDQPTTLDGVVLRFFSAITRGDLILARTCLTSSLSSAITDDALKEFFKPYCDIIDGHGVSGYGENTFLLVDNTDKITPFRFSLKAGLIDDITELN